MRRGWGAILLALGVLMVGWPGAASAHTDLADASPEPGAVVDRSIDRLSLEFGTGLAAGIAQVVVRDRDGNDHALGDPRIRGARVTVELAPLTVAGTYQVAYRVVGEDGHPVTGSYQFKLSAAAARAEASTSPSAATDTAGGEPTLDAAAAASTAPSGSAPPAAAPWTPWLVGAVVFLAMLAYGARSHVTRNRRRTPVDGDGGGTPSEASADPAVASHAQHAR